MNPPLTLTHIYINANCALERLLMSEAIDFLKEWEDGSHELSNGEVNHASEGELSDLQALGSKFLSGGECDLMDILGIPSPDSIALPENALAHLDFSLSPSALYDQFSHSEAWSDGLTDAMDVYKATSPETAPGVLESLSKRLDDSDFMSLMLQPRAWNKATHDFLNAVRQLHGSLASCDRAVSVLSTTSTLG